MTIITTLAKLAFNNPLGKYVLGGLGIAALFSAWLYSHDKAVIAEVRQADKEQGIKANDRAQEHFTAAAKPGAAERLRRAACRDCKP